MTPYSMLQSFLTLIGVGGILAIGKFLFSSGKAVARIETNLISLNTSLTEVKINHLPHLESKIDKVQEAFIKHLEFHGEHRDE